MPSEEKIVRLGGWARLGIAMMVGWSVLLVWYASVETVRADEVRTMFAVWLTPIVLMWACGLTARWIYRGFRA